MPKAKVSCRVQGIRKLSITLKMCSQKSRYKQHTLLWGTKRTKSNKVKILKKGNKGGLLMAPENVVKIC